VYSVRVPVYDSSGVVLDVLFDTAPTAALEDVLTWVVMLDWVLMPDVGLLVLELVGIAQLVLGADELVDGLELFVLDPLVIDELVDELPLVLEPLVLVELLLVGAAAPNVSPPDVPRGALGLGPSVAWTTQVDLVQSFLPNDDFTV
jgi:hypothetical protein